MLFSDSRWCLCVEFWIWDPVHHEVVFPIVWERLHNLPSYSWECTPLSPLYSLECHAEVCVELLEFCLMQLAIACFMNFLRGLFTQTVVLVSVFCMYFSSLYFLVRPLATLWCVRVKVPRPAILISVSHEAFTTPNISECYFWSFRGPSCLANNSRLHFYWQLLRRILST